MWLLLIPPAALLLALLWTALHGRPKRAREAMFTIEGYRRSMDALARPVGAADEPDMPAVYPGDQAHQRAPAAGGDPARPAEPPRTGTVVPASRAAAGCAGDGDPAETPEDAGRLPAPEAPGPRDGQPAPRPDRRESSAGFRPT